MSRRRRRKPQPSKRPATPVQAALPLAQPLPAQPSLWIDGRESRRRADQGAEQALYSSIGMPWAERAERWLLQRAEPFTSEHLVADVGLPNVEVGANRNNAVGAIVRAWAQRKRIERVGYTPSRRVESHGALLTIWQRSTSSAAA